MREMRPPIQRFHPLGRMVKKVGFLELIEEKLKAQNEYDYEITRERFRWWLRLGKTVYAVTWKAILDADSSHWIKQHTPECIQSRSMVCPECGAFIVVEYHGARFLEEDSYYEASCEQCSWSNDTSDFDDAGSLLNWLDENDYPDALYGCGCPSIEEPPNPESLVNAIYDGLYWGNKDLEKS